MKKLRSGVLFQVLFLLFSLVTVLLAFTFGEKRILLIPPFALFTYSLYIKSSLIYYYFIIVNFLGYGYTKGIINISITDGVFLLLLSFFVFSGKANQIRRIFEKYKTTLFVFTLFFLLCILSYVLNVSHYDKFTLVYSLFYLFRVFQFIAIWMMLSTLDIDKRMFNTTVMLILILSVLQLPFAVYQFLFDENHLDTGAYKRFHITGTISYHHTALGTFMLIPLALGLSKLSLSESLLRKISYSAIVLIIIALIVFSGSRSALLGVAVSVFLYIVKRIRFSKEFLGLIVCVVVVSIVMYLFTPLKEVFKQTFSSGQGTLDVSSASRFYIWQGALISFGNSSLLTKLFGYGIGAFITIRYPFTLWRGAFHITGAHNNLIHVLCEIGIVGLIVFLILWGYICYTLLKTKSKYGMFLFYSTIALLVSGVAQETLWFQKSMGNLWTFYIVVYSLVIKRAELNSSSLSSD